MSSTDVDELPDFQKELVTNMANEGIPVAAIGRVTSLPFDAVSWALHDAMSDGSIAELPRPDWPPNSSKSSRLPTVARMSPAALELACGTTFRLTKLEAGFLATLLRHDSADKEKLHGVVELQRSSRASRLDNSEPTDPRMVDVMICKLRKKLRERGGFEIKTSWGRGYYIEPAVKKLIYDRLGVPNT